MTSFINNPTFMMDCYKFDHRRQYPEGTTHVYSNLTPRGSRIPDIEEVLFFGFQAFLEKFQDLWQTNFFQRNIDDICVEYEQRTLDMLGPNDIGSDHLRQLHDLGYLPLKFRALAEGTLVPMRIPTFTVENTHPDFFWLVNYIETYLSAELWHPMTSATTAHHFRSMLDIYATATSSTPEFVDFQGHDFSYRGLTGTEAAAASSAGHLLSFAGTDTVPALDWVKEYYNPGNSIIGVSVPATEHSVMCAGGDIGEHDTFDKLLNLYPTGIVSVVSDTWDLWNVITKILPDLKDRILGRDGKLVIRPDSGDPANILCGDPNAGVLQPAYKGVIELLWDIFGGTINDKGYKELDPHIGAIYGDSITYERGKDICIRLKEKGFATTNVVFGVGSFTYQYVTRDTFGFAMKATWARVNGEPRDLYKDPTTDDGLKKSALGRLAVFVDNTGKFQLIEQCDEETENSDMNLLRVVWENGNFKVKTDWATIVNQVGKRYLR